MANKLKIALILAIVLLGLVLTVLIGFVLLVNSNEFTLRVDIKGDREITLNYGEEYVDQGANAWVYGTFYLKEGQQIPHITVDNPVNTDKIGTYHVTYTVEFESEGTKMTTSVQRVVHVVDTKAPVITLVDNPDYFTYPGKPYKEEGFTAYDEYDGDITNKVTCSEENGVVTYRVKDTSGNEAVVTRTIRYADLDAPVMTLKGENPMSILIGSDFVEPGVIAWDGCDGYISDQVIISNIEIDPYVPNSYTITYSVTDRAGNTASIERVLNVEAYENPETVTPSGKVIYLTFDDGPSRYTSDLLDVLKKYNVKATFFVVNTGYHDVLRRIVDEGHSIAIHCTNHTYSEIYQNEDAYFADMENMQRIIYEQTGVLTKLVRFPGGSSNTVSKAYNIGIMTRLTKALRARGYQYFDWNVDSDDAGGARTKEKVYENVTKGCAARRVSVVLQHDIKNYSVAAVEDIIKWGLENGYTFMGLDLTSPAPHHGLNN